MSNPVAPTGVDHVAINVSDVPGAITFYTETMGLVQNHTRPDFGFPGAWLDTANGQQVHLIEAVVPNNVGQHFALVYGDIEATVNYLLNLVRRLVLRLDIRIVTQVVNHRVAGDAVIRQDLANG